MNAVARPASAALPLSVRGLSKSFGAQRAVDDVGFELAPATVTGLSGPNGSGKSTLIHLVLGLLKPDAGGATLFGHAPGSAAARQRHGVMLQDAEFPALLKVRELLTLFRKGYAAPMAEAEVVRIAGLEAIHGKRYGKLSGGEKRRVQCALAICGDPSLLLLDEPTVHMDADSKELFWNAVYAMRGKGCCVVVVSHQHDEIRALADYLLVMERGRVMSHAAVGQQGGAPRYSRVSFPGAGAAPERERLLAALDCVREVRQVGRMTELIVTDVGAAMAALGRLGVDMAGVAIVPVGADSLFQLPATDRERIAK